MSKVFEICTCLMCVYRLNNDSEYEMYLLKVIILIAFFCEFYPHNLCEAKTRLEYIVSTIITRHIV